jgi:predicted DNA-binding ribbon-helix-helix protein
LAAGCLPVSRPVKRSVVIAGHRTSVSMEPEFWSELKRLADDAGLSIAALIARIDDRRRDGNLSSAMRVFVLESVARRGHSIS